MAKPAPHRHSLSSHFSQTGWPEELAFESEDEVVDELDGMWAMVKSLIL